MSIEALNCPNCGAAVASDRSQCEFCSARLKTLSCTVCLGLMFEGAKYCPRCGRNMSVVAVTEEKVGDCPRCKRKLIVLQLGNVRMCECEKCGGFWSDVATFEDVCSDVERQAVVLNFIGSDAHPHAHPATISYVPCPDCGQLMNRSNFARSSGVIVDMCKQHGVWFDADELPKILEFIKRGGIDRQREKEKIRIADERSRLERDRRNMGWLDRRSSGVDAKDELEDSVVGSIITRLFGV